jgi:hypothetical protein
MVEEGNHAVRQMKALEVARRQAQGHHDINEHAGFQQAADLLNPMQAGIGAFGGNGGRIHGAQPKGSNRQFQELFNDKR